MLRVPRSIGDKADTGLEDRSDFSLRGRMAAPDQQGNLLNHLLHRINHDNRHEGITTGANLGRESP